MTEAKNIAISSIKIDGGTQPREEIVESLVAEYAEAMAAGAEFPPVVVFNDGVKLWLADGFHRTHAARRAGLDEIAAEVHSGTKRDAVLHSVGANAAHGQRRTPADKRKAVTTLLTNPEVAKDPETGEPWSDTRCANLCNVSVPFVGKVRNEITINVNSDEPTRRTYTTKHGTTATMDTSNIGKRAPDQPDDQGSETDQPDARPESRGKGLRFAHDAIATLKKIPHNDGLRQDALDTVSKWIEDNR